MKRIAREIPKLNLEIFRLLYCLGVARDLALIWPPQPQLDLKGFAAPFGLDYLSPVLMGAPAAMWLRNFTILTLGLAAFGIGTRAMLLLSSVAFFALVEPFARVQDPQSMGLVCVTLVILATFDEPWSLATMWRRHPDLSRVQVPAWREEVLILLLGLAYLQAGVSKVLNSGWSWLSGATLASHLSFFYLFNDNSMELYLVRHPALLAAAAIAVLLFEVSFVLTVKFARLRCAYLIGAMIFHIVILQVMRIDFFWFFVWSYLILVDWSAVIVAVNRLRKRVAHREEAPTRGP